MVNKIYTITRATEDTKKPITQSSTDDQELETSRLRGDVRKEAHRSFH